MIMLPHLPPILGSCYLSWTPALSLRRVPIRVSAALPIPGIALALHRLLQKNPAPYYRLTHSTRENPSPSPSFRL
jgi:hypothetical protein